MEALQAPGVALRAEALLALRAVARGGRARAGRRLPAAPGTITTSRRGRGIEISDVRPWVEGDDIRHVDRNATARTGVPHVRTFCDERDRSALLIADFRPSMLFGTRRAFRSVAGAEALALVGWRFVLRGGRLGLLAVGSDEPAFLPPQSGERGMRAVVGGLVQAHARALGGTDVEDMPLDAALERALACAARDTTVVMATALEQTGAGFAPAARALAHRGPLGVILVTDAFERAAPHGLYPFIGGGGRRGWGMIGRDAGDPGDPRLAMLAGIGVRAVRLDAELRPEAMAAVLERLDAARA